MNIQFKVKKILVPILLSLIIWLALIVQIAFQPLWAAERVTTIIRVDADAISLTPDGSTWSQAYPTLQDGLAAAGTPATGDIVEIWVAEGIYYPDEGGSATNDSQFSSFDIPDGVHLYGGYKGLDLGRDPRDWETNLTILSGDITQNDTVDANGITRLASNIATPNAGSFIRFQSGGSNAVLDGFIVTGGALPVTLGAEFAVNGGAILVVDSAPTFRNLDVIGNRGVLGAGISIQNSTIPTESIQLENVTIEESITSGSGGGMYVNSARVSADGLTILNNESGDEGGGIFSTSAWLDLRDVLISGNSATRFGGGITHYGGELKIEDFLIQLNTSKSLSSYGGGGIHTANGGMFLNGKFQGNSSNRHGGGLYVRTGIATLTNVEFSGNEAQMNGGAAIFSKLSAVVGTNLTVSGNNATTTGGVTSNAPSAHYQNSVIWGNSDSGGSGTLIANFSHDVNATPLIRHSNIEGSGGSAAWVLPVGTNGGQNLAVDPGFTAPISPTLAPTITGDYKPISTSVMIDMGDNTADLDGPYLMTETIDMVAKDLNGNTRIQGLAVDIGAYEDTPLIMFDYPEAFQLREAGEIISLTMRLREEPPVGRRNIVNIDLSPSNEQCDVSVETVTLSSANWDTGVEIYVFAVDDVLYDPNETCTLVTADASAEAEVFDGFELPDYTFDIVDNDLPSLVFDTPVVTSTEHSTVTVSVSFSGTLPAEADVSFSSSDYCRIIQGSTLNFVPNTIGTPPELVIRTYFDDIETEDRTCTITGEMTSADSNYQPGEVESLEIIILNDDFAGITKLDAPSAVSELGESVMIPFVLDSQPTDSVTISFATAENCLISPGSFVFTTANWSVAQAVSVTPQEAGLSCMINSTVSTVDSTYAVLSIPTFSISSPAADPAPLIFLPVIIR